MDGSDVQLVAGKKSLLKRTGLRRSDLRGRRTFYLENAAGCHCEALATPGQERAEEARGSSPPTNN